MQKGTTLFQLRADHNGVFDGSNAGIAIQRTANVKPLPGGAGINITSGVVEVARNTALDNLEAFTIEATIKPARIGPNRQNIVEAQSPGIAFFLVHADPSVLQQVVDRNPANWPTTTPAAFHVRSLTTIR